MAQHRRIELQHLLERILGSKNVYFQPPESLKIKYPCIIYTMEKIDHERADNIGYISHPRYSIIHITRDPDESIYDEMSKLPYSSYDRSYPADNLHHNVYTLYY